jgi:histidine ammonia-lyase
MGATSAVKCLEVLNNLRSILAIELFNAAQALEFRRPFKSSEIIENLHASYRNGIPSVKQDVEMHIMIERSIDFLRNSSVPLN